MRKAEFVILCEDKQHVIWIRRYLIKGLRFNPWQVRVRGLPTGSRAGEQWVRDRYLREVDALRKRANHTSASLIVITDADTGSVEQRAQQLEDALVAAGRLRRGRDERIALVIPRRNVESWIHFVITETIDETKDFKLRYRDDAKACRRTADAMVELCREAKQELPPSLATACDELRRVTSR